LASHHGIFIYSGSDFNVVLGNIINHANEAGIWIQSSFYNSVIGNSVHDNFQNAIENKGAGILVNGDAFHNSIVANVSANKTGTSQLYGVRLLSGAKENIVMGNHCKNNALAPIFDESGQWNLILDIGVKSMNLPNLPSFATDAAAGAGGLLSGDLYKVTGTSPLQIAIKI
jgi:parallel beta-helix repeat protein